MLKISPFFLTKERNRMRFNKYVKTLFHMVGLSSIGAEACNMFYTLTKIALFGSVKLIEPNRTIIYTEVCLSFFSLIYLVYLIQRMVKEMPTLRKSKHEA